jgi:hypothetical protein
VERARLRQQASQLRPARLAGSGAALLTVDGLGPSLEASCRQCLSAAQSAIAWTLVPTVVK